MQKGHLETRKLELLILDEADKILDSTADQLKMNYILSKLPK